ncbi:hypothetical protein L2719_07235 [Shewanella schlegeliana]|nr:hypothetical protein [Shewanella schlegeliana]MCL1109337.1 hypothetical protein [Shewanella schlegeliana]GIU38122.1 hypothetical protein TUM4433_39350 [Shewanella schlegeliana]
MNKPLIVFTTLLLAIISSANSYALGSLKKDSLEQKLYEQQKDQQQDCRLNQLDSVLDYDAALVTRKYGLNLSTDNSVCWVLPHNKEQALLSYFQYYQSNQEGYPSYLWRVILVNRYSNKVEARYTGVMQENSAIKVHSDTNSIVHGEYALNDNTPALGLILDLVNYDNSPQSQQHGDYQAFKTNRFMTLFVQQGHKLRPVLKHLPLDYEIEGTDMQGSNGGVYLHYGVQGKIEVLATSSHGYHDLKLMTQGQQYRTDGEYDQVEPIHFSSELKFDGTRYPVITERLPAPEFWQINQTGVNFLSESNVQNENRDESPQQTPNPASNPAENQDAN